jgi:hypothetical protein
LLTFVALLENVNEVAADVSERNRKILAQSKRERRFGKMHRRAKMLTVSKYLKESVDKEDVLSVGNGELSEAFNETNEMIVRARLGMTGENLSVFIHRRLVPVLGKAEARYARVSDALWSMKSEMHAVWDDVKKDLRGMNSEIERACVALKAEATMAAEDVRGSLLPQSLFIEHSEVGMVDRGLFVVASGEFCAFVLLCIRFHIAQARRKYA